MQLYDPVTCNMVCDWSVGLLGSSDLEAAFVDQTYGITSDTFTKLLRVFKEEFSNDEEKVRQSILSNRAGFICIVLLTFCGFYFHLKNVE